MFGAIRKFLGLIKVVEQGDYVLISGLPADFINFSINKIWNTSKISTYMFNRITNNQIVFHRFFVPDVIYTLNVVKNDKRARSQVNVIEKIISEIYANTWAKSILEDPKPFLARDKLSDFKKTPLEHQLDFFDTFEKNTQRYQLKGYLLGAVPGSGKAHSLDVKLRTPNKSFILMKDIKVGDTILDRRLKPTKVIGVFPQGVKKIYKFTLEDGRSTEVCLEHLWQAYFDNQCEVIDTKKIQALLKQNTEVFIDLPNALNLAQSRQFSVYYEDNLNIVKKGELQYRELGGVTEIEKDSLGYVLHVEFRANNRIKVASIDYIGEKEAQCISVDNPEKLYIVDDFIVTHNTLSSLMLSRMLQTDTNVFLVPKNSLDKVWRASLTEEIKGRQNFWISDGLTPIKPGYKDYVIHHDHIVKVVDFFDRNRSEFGEVYVNLDESHFFNEITSNRTNYVVNLARDILQARYTLFMSGTPIKAVGSEAIPLLRIIDPFFHTKVEDRFLKIYGKSKGRANDILQNRMGTLTFKVDKQKTVGNEVTLSNGYVKIPNGNDYTLDSIRIEMKKFIEERMRYYKSNASVYDKEYHRILDLHKRALESKAEKQEFEEYVKAVEKIRKQYDPILRKDDIVLANKYERYKIIPKLSPEDKSRFRDAKSVYKYYFLKVQGEALGRVLGKLRVQCNVDMLQGLDEISLRDSKGKEIDVTSLEKEIFSTNKKTLIFTSFVEVVKAAEELLKKKGFNPLIVYGETNKELASIVSRFAKDENANPLIATFKSLSTAVPLTMANNTIMLNAPFRDYEFQQALSRTDRIGQDAPVYCTTIYLDTDGKPNISTRSKDIMDWSKQQIEEILGFKMEDVNVSLEDSNDKPKTDPYESLAEKLDMGVDTMLHEDGINPDDENNIVETDKGKRRAVYWNAW